LGRKRLTKSFALPARPEPRVIYTHKVGQGRGFGYDCPTSSLGGAPYLHEILCGIPGKRYFLHRVNYYRPAS